MHQNMPCGSGMPDTFVSLQNPIRFFLYTTPFHVSTLYRRTNVCGISNIDTGHASVILRSRFHVEVIRKQKTSQIALRNVRYDTFTHASEHTPQHFVRTTCLQ